MRIPAAGFWGRKGRVGLELGRWRGSGVPRQEDPVTNLDEITWNGGFQRRADALRMGHGVIDSRRALVSWGHRSQPNGVPELKPARSVGVT